MILLNYLIYTLYTLAKLFIFYPYGAILYPLAYMFKDKIRKSMSWYWMPLWIVLDDEDDYGEPFFLRNSRTEDFITSYRWAGFRNNCHNLHTLFKVKLNSSIVFPKMRFKWEYLEDDKWINGWTVQQGDRLSEEYSTIGTHYEIYPFDTWWKIWTYSYAGKVGPFLWNIKLGWNDRGEMIFEWKWKIYKKKYDAHWSEHVADKGRD